MMVVGLALAVLIGISLGLLGGGGAILTIPVLVYVFGMGMKQAVPMSLAVVGLTSVVGAARHWRAGHVSVRAAIGFGPAAMVGAFAGTRAAFLVSGSLQLTLFALVLFAAAGMMWRRRPAEEPGAARARPLLLIGLLGLGVGFLTGFLGVGGGFMYVPALALLGGLDMKSSVGTSLVLIALSCTTGLAGYVGRIPIDWPLLAGFTLLAFAGVGIGSTLVHRVSPAGLRRGFAVFLFAIGAFVLIRGEQRRPEGGDAGAFGGGARHGEAI